MEKVEINFTKSIVKKHTDYINCLIIVMNLFLEWLIVNFQKLLLLYFIKQCLFQH